jgi:hypothetical protein
MMGTCNWGRSTLAAVGFAAVGWFAGWLVWGNIFKDAVMAHANLWRPAGSQEMMVYPLLGLLLAGFAVSCLYSKFNAMGEKSLERDLQFGIKLWLIAVGVASLPFYGYSPVSIQLLWACVLDKFILFVGGTLVVSWALCGGSCSKS